MSFIFQSVPERYDLRTRMQAGDIVSWVASRHRKAMTQGDTVYFWLAGEARHRGLYGWGRIAAAGPHLDDQGTYRIKVKYEKSFQDCKPPAHIPAAAIRADPVLENLLILRMATGTNFLLTAAEDAALHSLIEKRLGTAWAP